MNSSTHIYFDLDGTLTDPVEGICNCIQYAMRELGHEPPAQKDLHWCIGPPLIDSFSELLGAEYTDDAIASYRERFSEIGWKENTVYEGIPAALADLKATGASLYVATSKPHIYANRILEHFDLAGYFTSVYGCELDGTHGYKNDLLRHALEQEPDAEHRVMIGDRRHDMSAAVENGLRPIGITWGYGTMMELVNSGADRIARSPSGLVELLAGNKDG